MKAVYQINDLTGKTIKRAVWLDSGETFGILFTDSTYCSVDVCFFGDSHQLELDDPGDLSNSDLLSLGVLDQEEFDRLKLEMQKKYRYHQEKQERAKYEELKAKFE